MQEESNRPPEMDAQLKRALSHPKRTEILGYLMQKRDKGTDEAELAVLDPSMPTVRYHLTVLRDADLITHIEDPEPGTTERYIAAASVGA